MKLELKHLAPYLPYGLKFYVEHLDGTQLEPWTLTIDSNIRQIIEFQNKPILRPLSDLTKDEEFEQFCKEQIICADVMITNCNDLIKVEVLGGVDELITIGNEIASECSYLFYVWLIKHHFDVFGLIEKGLAIDINTL